MMLPDTARACNVELPPPGLVPDWLHLLPAGPQIVGLDGRSWINDRPAAVVAAHTRPIPIDFEHATELRAPQGVPAPAAGWIEALELRKDGIWGRAVWTPRGRMAVAAREYRYLSPAFRYQKEPTRITALVSVGLTNRPNLEMTALNQAQKAPAGALSTFERELCHRLGLSEVEYFKHK